MSAPEWLDRFSALLFPKRCVLCGKVVEYDNFWCGCKISKMPFNSCTICDRIEGDCICEKKSILFTSSPLVYTDTVKNAVIHLKNENDSRTIAFFAEEMKSLFLSLYADFSITMLVPVPMKESKQKENGYNHAGVLAEKLANLLGIPCYNHFLIRLEDSLSQHEVGSKQERIKNAASSYRRNDKICLTLADNILLIDDVCTTGSTLMACAEQLLALGVANVYAMTATSALLNDL